MRIETRNSNMESFWKILQIDRTGSKKSKKQKKDTIFRKPNLFDILVECSNFDT